MEEGGSRVRRTARIEDRTRGRTRRGQRLRFGLKPRRFSQVGQVNSDCLNIAFKTVQEEEADAVGGPRRKTTGAPRSQFLLHLRLRFEGSSTVLPLASGGLWTALQLPAAPAREAGRIFNAVPAERIFGSSSSSSRSIAVLCSLQDHQVVHQSSWHHSTPVGRPQSPLLAPQAPQRGSLRRASTSTPLFLLTSTSLLLQTSRRVRFHQWRTTPRSRQRSWSWRRRRSRIRGSSSGRKGSRPTL